MIEAMWGWAAIGVILLAVEMATVTFYALWFGIAALALGIITWMFPQLSYAVQFMLYAVLSLGSLGIWRRYYKKTSPSSRVGQAQGEEIGRIGTVIDTTSPAKSGNIRFTQGLMGSKEWVAVSDETIKAGSQATVIAVEGNTLRISKNDVDKSR
ncbi:MAG: NfeD family protein [Betaproteobacteria bacterium]|nr:NfeD family protein [Betaproteobacteria bacterium]